MVAALLFNHKVALFSVMYRDPKPRMMGFIDLGPNAKVEDLRFHTHDFKPDAVLPSKLIIVGTTQLVASEPPSSCIWYVKCPPLDYDPTVAVIPRDVCPMVSGRLQLKDPSDRVTAVCSSTRKALMLGFASGGLTIYPVPSQMGAPAAKHLPLDPLEELPPHGQLVTRVVVASDSSWLVSGSMDGMIRKMSLNSPEKDVLIQKFVHNPYNGGVAELRCNEDGSMIASTGGADGIVVWSDPQAVLSLPEAPELGDIDDKVMEVAVLDVDDRSVGDFKVWVPISSEQKAAAAAEEAGDDPEVSAVAQAQRKVLLHEVDTLRKKLRSIVEQNTTCPDLEKIDRKEFCIDFEERDIIAAKTKERCDALRAQLQRENHARQLTRDRLIKEFWDPMRTKGCLISSLMSNLSVSNYPERIVSEEEKGTIRKLRILRQTESLEDQASAKSREDRLVKDRILQSEPFTTGKEQYIVNWWTKKAAEAQEKEGRGRRRRRWRRRRWRRRRRG
jgi:hypothetical protein